MGWLASRQMSTKFAEKAETAGFEKKKEKRKVEEEDNCTPSRRRDARRAKDRPHAHSLTEVDCTWQKDGRKLTMEALFIQS